MQEPIEAVSEQNQDNDDQLLEQQFQGLDTEDNAETSPEPAPLIIRRKFKHASSHPLDNILSDPKSGIKTRSNYKNLCAFYGLFLL